MKKDAKRDSFWLSYSDLMTSLFFVMLVLFITGICILTTSDQTMAGLKAKMAEAEDKIETLEKCLKNQTAQYNDLKDKYDKVVIKKEQYEKLMQLTAQFKSLSESSSLRYDEGQKTFIAKDFEGIEIFEHDSDKIKKEYISTVKTVGKDLQMILKKLNSDNKDSKFLLVIEGNTANKYDKSISKDANYSYELSYKRALALYNQWKSLNLRQYNTEVLICGSGMNGINRDKIVEENNKRFVIQILPKLSRTDQ